MDWQTLVQTLTDMRWPEVPTLVAGWEWAALSLLLAAVVVLVLWDDWRVALLAWVAVGVAVTALLTRILPVPWALSRMLAAGLDGALLWLGARRWPRPARVLPGGDLWVRLPALAVASLAGWQVLPYVHAFRPDVPRADAALVVLLGGLLLLALGGDTLHAALGMLLWVNAAALFLAALPIPSDWFLLLTLLDVLVAAGAAVSLASEGAAAAAHGGEGEL